jgi:hypothetical protein
LGLEFSPPLSPALKRWAKFVRPSGAGFSAIPFHRIAREPILAHTLKGRLILESSRYRSRPPSGAKAQIPFQRLSGTTKVVPFPISSTGGTIKLVPFPISSTGGTTEVVPFPSLFPPLAAFFRKL